MAKVKSFKGLYDSTDARLYLNENAIGFALSPDGSVIASGNEVVDQDSLHPIYNTSVNTLTELRGFRHPIASHALMMNRATISTLQDNLQSTLVTTETSGRAARTSHTTNIPVRSNLDKQLRLSAGPFYSFQDSSGTTHNIVTRHNITAEIASTANTSFVIFEGDDIRTSPNQITFLNDFGTHPIYTGGVCQFSDVIAVDTATKTIYFSITTVREVASYFGTGLVTDIWKRTYTTAPVDGSLSVGALTRVALNQGSNSGGYYLESKPRFFCGFNNAGKPCFLTFSENDRTLGIGNYNHSDYCYAYPPGGSYWTKSTLGNSQNHWMDVYDAGSNVVTNIAALKFTNGIGQRWTGTSAPSHFEPSPIAGETDIYYAYSLAFAATSPASYPYLIQHKWDKANDTFATIVCTGVNIWDYWNDSWSQYITTNTDTVSRLDWTASVNTVTLTNDGVGGYFLSVYSQHYDSKNLGKALAINKNIVTFQVDPANMSTLSYHSQAVFPCYAAIGVNEDNTTLCSIEPGAAKVWNWTANGWTLAATAAGNFYALGADATGTIWGASADTSNFTSAASFPFQAFDANLGEITFNLELITPDLPNTVSVVFEDTGIAYLGNVLTKNILVNAYNSSGVRIASDVVLKISGTNAVFNSNNATVLSTTTSDTEDTVIALKISGPGFINVSASFEL